MKKPTFQRPPLSSAEDEDRDGLRNVGFFTAQPFDLADSPRELYQLTEVSDKDVALHPYFSSYNP
jgi:hypothetical protein